MFNKNISEKSAICNQQKYSLSNTRNINTDDSMNAENYIKAFQGVMGFYGRWFLPIPRRVALSVCVAPVKTTKTASPSVEDVERLHEQVYGRLKAVYDAQKAFAGYADRELVIS